MHSSSIPDSPPTHRVPTYHPRRRKLSPAKANALLEFGHLFVCSSLVTAAADQPLWLDLGFGMGESTVDWAARYPTARVVGIDIHTPGVANVVAQARQRELFNLRVVAGDAVAMMDALPNNSVAALRILFPDPWPRRRQQGRRLIQPAFATTASRLLRPGAVWRLATDDGSYAQQMLTVITGNGSFVAIDPEIRSVTRFELRGRAAKHTIHELAFERTE